MFIDSIVDHNLSTCHDIEKSLNRAPVFKGFLSDLFYCERYVTEFYTEILGC